jgi:uracil-DNA glycosylase
MMAVTIEPEFASWRKEARKLLALGVPPSRVQWNDEPAQEMLLNEVCAEYRAGPVVKVPSAFLKLAETVACHRDARRWAILYRMAYRLTLGGEKPLLAMATDPDTRQANVWAKAIGRDIHKMHAFVRFRLLGVDESSGREQFIAWFEPEHRIVKLAVPFFVKRFTSMDWSILTPDECAHWDGETLRFTPGLRREDAPAADAHDDLWRTYYRSIFNPARIKLQAMRSEMPMKYWKNLPEAELIRTLAAEGEARVNGMLQMEPLPETELPKNAYLAKLHQRRAEAAESDARGGND